MMDKSDLDLEPVEQLSRVVISRGQCLYPRIVRVAAVVNVALNW